MIIVPLGIGATITSTSLSSEFSCPYGSDQLGIFLMIFTEQPEMNFTHFKTHAINYKSWDLPHKNDDDDNQASSQDPWSAAKPWTVVRPCIPS